MSSVSTSLGPQAASNWLRAAISLYAVLFFTLFATDLDIYLSLRGLLPVNSLVILFAAFAALPILFLLSGRLADFLDRFFDVVMPSMVPIFLFILWIVMHVLAAGRTVVSGPDTDFAVIFPILQFGLLLLGIAIATARDWSGGAVRLGLASALVVLGSSVIVETMFPDILGVRDLDASERAGGFALNANVAAFILNATLACFLDYRRSRGADLLAILLTLVAVLCTLSRSGLAQFLIVTTAYFLAHGARVFTGASGAERLRFVAKVVLVPLVVIAIAAAIGPFLSASQPEIRERIETLTLRGDAVYEDPYRYMLLEHYYRLALEHPLVGLGTAYTKTLAAPGAPLGLGPHNMYLRAWIDHGLVGLGLYAAILVSLLVTNAARRNIGGVVLVLLVAEYSFFAHDAFDTKATHLFAGLALGQSFSRRSGA